MICSKCEESRCFDILPDRPSGLLATISDIDFVEGVPTLYRSQVPPPLASVADIKRDDLFNRAIYSGGPELICVAHSCRGLD
ncbi:hypothetical protein PAXRUDRAFT_827541, partial [Paxillus rubicundulus Ve08.2h10]